MTRPGGAEFGEDFEGAGQRIADDERFIAVGGGRGDGVGPEVNKAEGGGDGLVGAKGKEGKRESEPLVESGVKGVESRLKMLTVVMGGGHVAVVGRAESKERKKGLVGGDEVEERRRR